MISAKKFLGKRKIGEELNRLAVQAMDTISKKQRSWNMSRIRSKDTTPELRVRSVISKAGYRFRLHDKSLRGKPDLIFKKHKIALFVHGCFWHHHQRCKRANFPKSNKGYWAPKIHRNVQRDRENRKILKKDGWRVIIVWECQTKTPEKILTIFKNGNGRLNGKGNKKT